MELLQEDHAYVEFWPRTQHSDVVVASRGSWDEWSVRALSMIDEVAHAVMTDPIVIGVLIMLAYFVFFQKCQMQRARRAKSSRLRAPRSPLRRRPRVAATSVLYSAAMISGSASDALSHSESGLPRTASDLEVVRMPLRQNEAAMLGRREVFQEPVAYRAAEHRPLAAGAPHGAALTELRKLADASVSTANKEAHEAVQLEMAELHKMRRAGPHILANMLGPAFTTVKAWWRFWRQ
jgi:hypothetical protein